jgi:uncharacterized protein (DUF433 family)
MASDERFSTATKTLGGASQEEILGDGPNLKAEDIRACIAYAARYLNHGVLVAA